MARRRSNKSSLLEDLSMLPWWVSVTISVFVFIFLQFILPIIELNTSILQGVATMLTSMAFFIAAIFLLPALTSFLRGVKARRKHSSLSEETWSQPKQSCLKKPYDQKKVREVLRDQSSLTLSSKKNASEKPNEWSENLLKQIEWKRFEEVCRAYFEVKGFVSKVTDVGADGGIDIKLYKQDSNKPAVLVQCKAWNTQKIGVKSIREFFGVMASEGVSQGAFMATGEFTGDARKFARDNRITLASGGDLLTEIMKLPTETQTSLLKVAIEDDYMTPTCASCNIKMVLRTIKKGKNAGNELWGCLNYPRCKIKIYT
ncbi:MAG: restriction endonuclease [Mariprofundaceae bacterium]